MLAPIAFSSKKPTRTRSSTTDSELLALRVAIRESSFLQGILEDLCLTKLRTTLILSDSRNCVINSNSLRYPTAKNLRLDFHAIKEDINAGRIIIISIPGWSNLSDYLTKRSEQTIQVINLEHISSGRSPCFDGLIAQSLLKK